ncbi:arsenate reductase (glutaredoxin) [Colwellia sp. KU-HH00111]|uniref:arsenate reductase (glutaredoxin) n=1 Tax=Colwellia sp. KU-HH00111 TaxID=3127652 RepID=UPI00310243E4
MLTIYHNPRCSKSRQTLELLQENTKQELTIIEYLKTPLSQETIVQLLKQLNCTPLEMMRVKETEFKEQGLKGADDNTLIAAMAATPKLIERPIVSNGNKAVIGRPPTNALVFC